MDRLQAMEMFVRVVETGSFSKAAREFNTTQPTVTKQVAAIEARLKVRLLNRNTRGVSLTEPARSTTRSASHRARGRGGRQHRAAAPDAGAGPAARGQLGGLRAPRAGAAGAGIHAQHPQLQVDLSFEDRYTDLVAQGVDVAIRMGKLADSSLGARFLGANPWLMVASPAYLKKHGTPKRRRPERARGADLQQRAGRRVWRVLSPRAMR
jgi:DNA-binding transcriptional LysR family regulator